MKKSITSLVFMSFVLITSLIPSLSQAQIIFEEDFNSGGMPSTFTIINNDGLTPNASVSYVTDAWIVRDDFIAEGDSCAFSTSWYSPAGTSDDWMITPQINLTTNNILEWEAFAPDASYPDGYEVRLSTTTPTIAAFTTVLFTVAGENAAWTSRSVNLQAAGFSNQPVYIAWHNNSTDQFILLVDSIRVSVAVTADAAMASTDSLGEYTIVPVDHLVPQNISGTVSNAGLDTLVDVHAKINVYDGTQTLQNTLFTDTIPTLAAMADGTVSVTGGWIPPSADFWILEYVVQHSAADGNSINDTAYRSILVSDSTYARDNGQITGSLGIGAGVNGAGRLGQDWDLLTGDVLTSIGYFAAFPDAGEPAAFAVYDFAGGVPNNVVALSDTLIYPDDTARFYTIPINGGSVSLPPGKYATCIIEFDSTAAVGTTTSIFTVGTTWIDWPTSPAGGWTNNEAFGPQFARTFVIRPNFGEACANPIADFTSITNLFTVSFSDASTTATTPSYQWDFGDGNTSTLQNPQHTYAALGTYTVCQIVSDSCGADTVCSSIQITCPTPTSSWSSSNNLFTTSFSDASTSAGTLSYLWDFGDGNTSTMQNPQHTYAMVGTYTVCQTISDTCGSDSSCSIVEITCPAPTSMWSSSSNQLTVSFTDASSSSTTLTGYLWDFGDGNTSTMAEPTHIYAADGTYTVCLTVSDTCGTDSTCMSVTVSCPAPTAEFEAQHFGNMLYNFVDNSSTANTITSYMWDFGDGTTSTLQNPMHTFSSTDNFTVCLTITDSCGSDTSCTTLTITTGLSDEFANSIKVFPNPNQGQFTIDIDLPQATDLDIAVFDLLGKQVNAFQRTQVAKEEIQLNLSEVGTGIYLLQVLSEQGRYMERIEVIK